MLLNCHQAIHHLHLSHPWWQIIRGHFSMKCHLTSIIISILKISSYWKSPTQWKLVSIFKRAQWDWNHEIEENVFLLTHLHAEILWRNRNEYLQFHIISSLECCMLVSLKLNKDKISSNSHSQFHGLIWPWCCFYRKMFSQHRGILDIFMEGSGPLGS